MIIRDAATGTFGFRLELGRDRNGTRTQARRAGFVRAGRTGRVPPPHALLLGSLLYRSRLVPRVLPLLGFIEAPLLVASFTAVLFDVWDEPPRSRGSRHFRSHCGSSHWACG
jgi:hypothetical protein